MISKIADVSTNILALKYFKLHVEDEELNKVRATNKLLDCLHVFLSD